MKQYIKNIIPFILVFAIFFAIGWFSDISNLYASDDPSVNLYIQGEGSRGGPIFNSSSNLWQGLWAPGVSNSGVLRINNNYSDRVRVHNLALTMKIEKLGGEAFNQMQVIDDEVLFKLFAENMKLTIKRGKAIIFNKTIYNSDFKSMLYVQGNSEYKGFNLPVADIFNIDKGDYVDLKYIVTMDESAGNELQGLRATVDFIINAEENQIPNTPKPEDKDRDDINDTNTKPVQKIEVPIEDIPEGYWAKDCITNLIDKGIVKGYIDGTIRPENFITRAEAAATINRALGIGEENNKLYYIDDIPRWAYGYISALTKRGMMIGNDKNQFMSENNITRQEAFTALMRSFNRKLKGPIELSFVDNEKIGGWALDFVKTAVQENVVTGYPDNTVRPKDHITRAEFFTIICKLLKSQ